MKAFLVTLAFCLLPLAVLWLLASRHTRTRCAGEPRAHAWRVVRRREGCRSGLVLRAQCARCGVFGAVVGYEPPAPTPRYTLAQERCPHVDMFQGAVDSTCLDCGARWVNARRVGGSW